MAKLTRVRPDVDPGFHRVRAGRGFRYLDRDGEDVSVAVRRRIRSLSIPPAWTEVWSFVEPRGHIQAVGTDAAGRRQYIYHHRWRERRDRAKFSRALALAGALGTARGRVTSGLRADALTQEHALSVAFRMLDAAAPRVGSARYLDRHGSRGLTTLRRRDASVSGSVVTLSFPAKSGRHALLEVDDEDLAAAVKTLAVGSPRSPLLWYLDGRRQIPLRPDEVNAHIRDLTGGSFTAKDFRTLRGTILAAQTLARIGASAGARDRRRAENDAVRAVADFLGNTRAVARGSYIDPRVFARYEQGHLIDPGLSPESGIRALLLGEHAG